MRCTSRRQYAIFGCKPFASQISFDYNQILQGIKNDAHPRIVDHESVVQMLLLFCTTSQRSYDKPQRIHSPK